MANDPREALAAAKAAEINQRYGHKTAFAGGNPYERTSVPSPSLMFDYKSGLGGFPRGEGVEVFAPESLGKSTIMGYGALRGAQQMGLLTGLIATEPKFDDQWVIKNGVDPKYNVTAFPDNIDDAFDILRDWVFDGTIDYIVFDSVVGTGTAADQEENANARPGGLAKTITWQLQRIIPRMKKNNVGVMFINQIRDDQKARIAGMVEAPGGHALKHLCTMRVQMKPGKDRFTLKIEGEDQLIGRAIKCIFKKANAHNALGKSAEFNFFHVDTDGQYPFGVDIVEDIINAGKLTKVIEPKGAWLYHDLFPSGKLQGKSAVAEFLKQNPDVVPSIRTEVLNVMIEQKVARTKPELKAVDVK